MKLVLVSAYPQIDGQINGGVEGVAYSLVEGFRAKSNIDLYVITPSNIDHAEKKNGITIFKFKQARIPGFLAYWTLDRIKIHKILSDIKPDITHFQGLIGWSIGYKGKYIATIHGVIEKDVLFKGSVATEVRHKILKYVEKYARKRAKNLIVINDYIEELFGNMFKGKVFKIPNPVLNDYFEIENSPSKKNILYIGRISELKNILGILELFKGVCEKEPDVVLNLVGSFEDEAYLKQCEAFTRINNLQDKVIFHGSLAISEIKEKYRDASLLLLMSKQEVAPMVISEAMAAGVPVVANNICGIKYMIDHGKTGFKYDVQDTGSIINTIVELLSNEHLRREISINAKEKARKTYSIENVTQQTMTAYNEVLLSTPNKSTKYA